MGRLPLEPKMEIEDTKTPCPFCGYKDSQTFTYAVCERLYKTSVCRRCAKKNTSEVIKEEEDDK